MDAGGIQPPSTKIVIANDGRMKVLDNKERFLCFKSEDGKFNIPTVGLASVERGDVILAFDGNKAFYPCVVGYISDRSYGQGYAKNDINIKIYNMHFINKGFQMLGLFTEDNSNTVFDEYVDIKLVPLNDVKFIDMPYEDFIEKKSKEIGMDMMSLSSLLPKHSIVSQKLGKGSVGRIANSLVMATDENTTKVVKKRNNHRLLER
jgi:hypothetical protein